MNQKIDIESGKRSVTMKIINGTYIDPIKNEMVKKDIEISDVNAADSVAVNSEEKNELIIDATGLMIAPGLVDTHSHFRDPGYTYKEDILSGAEAAKAGGYTDIVLMANTNPKVDNPDTLKYVLEKGNSTDINIFSCANVTMNMEGKVLTDMENLLKEGAVGFTDDGVPLMDEKVAYEAMKTAAKLGVPISFHEENPTLIGNNGVNRGKASEYYKISGSPREAEVDLIKRDIEIALRIVEEIAISPKIVIQHISTKEGVDLVRQAKKEGLDVHAEATPHHFSLTEEAVIEHGTMAKMNPPLRTEEDRLAILEGLKDGTIDLIATDHAPHSAEEKSQDITKAPSGIIGLETALSLSIKNLVEPGVLTYPELFMKISVNPASLYGLREDKEYTEFKNLVIFDPNEEKIYDHFASKSQNSPFVGAKLPGTVKYTICNGIIRYSHIFGKEIRC